MATFDASLVNDAARLSVAAYPGNLSDAKSAGWTVLDPTTFRPVDTPTDNDFFFGDIFHHSAAFVAVKGGTLAIVFRGTDTLAGLPDPYDWFDATFAPLAHYKKLVEFVAKSIEYANNSAGISDILIAGHSLGGQMAEMFAARSGEGMFGSGSKFDPADVSIVTFGSPGIPGAIMDPVWDDRVLGVYHTEDAVHHIFDSPATSADIAAQSFVFSLASSVSSFSYPAALLEGVAPSVSVYIHPGTLISIDAPFFEGGYFNFTTWGNNFAPEHSKSLYLDHSSSIQTSELMKYAPLDINHFIVGGTVASPYWSDDIGLAGGSGNDFVLGLGGNDSIKGNDGNDLLDGGDNNDTISGGLGDDRLAGGGGNDLLDGGEQSDTVWGGRGADDVRGGPGDDVLYGEGPLNSDNLSPGADTLVGAGGNDILIGGGEFDTYRFAPGWGQDVVIDSNHGAIGADNRLEFTGIGGAELNFSQNGVNLVITWDGGPDKVTVEGYFGSANSTTAAQDWQVQTADGPAAIAVSSVGAAAPVPPANHAPVVSFTAATVPVNGSIPASSFVNAYDPDAGDQIVSYRFADPVGNGFFKLNGVMEPSGIPFDVSAGQLSGLQYFGGTAPGFESVSIRAFDGEAWSAPANATLVAWQGTVNQAPIADNEAVTIRAGEAVVIPVLQGDVDPENGALRVTGTSDPLHGSAGPHPSAQAVIYVPDPGFSGIETFTYTVADPAGAADIGVVTVTVLPASAPPANQAPVAASFSTTVNIGGSYSRDLLDPSLVRDPDAGDTLSLTDVRAPSYGTLVRNGSQVTYSPNSGFGGSDQIVYTVTDNHGASATGAITIDVNFVPDAVDDQVVTAPNTPIVINVLGNDSDGDHDPIVLNNIGILPTMGSVAVNADQSITYTPNANASGVDSFSYYIHDGKGGIDTAWVTVSVGTTGPGGNVQIGGSGNDHLVGGSSNDALHGNEGSDTLNGGAGNDLIDGGPGLDILDLSGASSETFVTLRQPGTAADGTIRWDDPAFLANDGQGGRDSVRDMEGVNGSEQRDVVEGNDGDNRILGNGGNDLINALRGNDTVEGGNGNDQIDGFLGDDRLFGGPGDDAVIGNDGADFIDGGAGNDDLRGGGGADTVSGGADNDNLFGNTGNDRLEGDDGNDTLDGHIGEDALYGGRGNDLLQGGADNDYASGGEGDDQFFHDLGNDTFDGGDGFDLVEYNNVIAGERGVVVDLASGLARVGDSEIDVLISIEAVTGSAYRPDVLLGSASGERLNGEYGDDFLNGRGGADTLQGGLGADTIEGGSGNDNLVGGSDFDTYEFAAGWGNDTLIDSGVADGAVDNRVSFSAISAGDLKFFQDGTDLIVSRFGTDDRIVVKSYFADATGTVATQDLQVAVEGVEVPIVVTAPLTPNFAPTVTATNATIAVGQTEPLGPHLQASDPEQNAVTAYELRDDSADPASGFLAVNGQALTNGGTFDVSAADLDGIEFVAGMAAGTESVVVRVSDGLNWSEWTTWNANVVVPPPNSPPTGTNLNQFVGYKAGTGPVALGDIVVSDADVGQSVEATLTLSNPAAGALTVSGAAAFDAATGAWDVTGTVTEVNAALAGVAFVPSGTQSQATIGVEISEVGLSSLQTAHSLEGLIVLQRAGAISGTVGSDALQGTPYADNLQGLDAADALDAGGGNDQLDGGGGDDLLTGGAGNDTLIGGLGNDVANYFLSPAAVSINLGTGAAGDGMGGADALSGVEGALGSAFHDVLVGDGSNNFLYGGVGNDMLDGRGGADTLIGGEGNDTLVGDAGADQLAGGPGADVFDFNALGSEVDTIADFLAGVGGDVLDLVNVVVGYTGLVDDFVRLTVSGSNTLVSIDPDGGIDNFQDVATLSNVTGLSASTMVANGNIVLPAIVPGGRNIVGTSGSNNLSGTAGNDTISGLAGNDSLSGLAGNDTLNGGAGKDTISGGVGDDVLIGGAGKDALSGGLGADVFDYDLVSDSAKGSTKRDVISDFKKAEGDKIDLSTIDADTDGTAGNQAFTFIGGSGFSKVDGQLRFANGLLQGDTNGDGTAEIEIQLTGVTSLSVGDIIL